jgi:hypothetical protein
LGITIAGWRCCDLDAAEDKNPLLQHYIIMPGKKHVRGASSKERRQYEHIKKSAQKSGRYGKRAKEVAARTVMKRYKRKRK